MAERNEIRLEVEPAPKDGKEVDCVGLHLGRALYIPIEVAREMWKKAILDYFRNQGKKPVPGAPFISIVMPCGQEIEYETYEDIPDDDVPCSCGKPNHWFVRHVMRVKVEQN